MRKLMLIAALLTGALLTDLGVSPTIHAGQVDEDLIRVFEDLKPGQRIRAQVHRHGDIAGEYVDVATDTFIVVNGDGEHRLPQRQVAALWLAGNASQKGATIGGGAGLVLGIIGGLIAVGMSDWDFCLFGECEDSSDPEWKFLAYGIGIGTAAGVVVGAAAGSGVTDWRLLYKSPGYHEALWSDCGHEPPGLRRIVDQESPGALCDSGVVNQTNDLPTDRLRLGLGCDDQGRLMLAATIDF